MIINTKNIVSMSEANQNFTRVARVAEANGAAVIFKNNKPKFVLVEIENNDYIELTDNEKIDVIAMRVLKKYRAAFEELAK